MQDARNRRVAFNHPATRLNRADKRTNNGVGPALANGHTEGLACHAFQIGEKRAARDIGCEIQMHAPSPKHRLHLRRFEGAAQPVARRAGQELRHVERGSHPFGAQCFEHKICKRTKPHRAAQKAKEMRGLGRKAREQLAPCLGVTL